MKRSMRKLWKLLEALERFKIRKYPGSVERSDEEADELQWSEMKLTIHTNKQCESKR